ncbi:MAG: DNA adenine methylase [Treponema sp.]|jgi:DNA adenine methylase|nr:DNA adenine methylase [Treponema sp.]
MRTPLSYYGGKQQLATRILGMIPEHQIYCEPFCGGAAIFFAKEPSRVEIINDTNGEVINFYEALKRDFPALEREIEISLHSRKQHRQARVVYENPDMFDRIKRAWAIWMLANGSYGCKLDGGFGYDRTGTTSNKLAARRADFNVDYAIRLQRVQIECCDALRIIRSRDTPETFFYLDPPYVGTEMGHYDGYTQMDFDTLLGLLEGIKGKFLLSSFHNVNLADFTRRNGWHTVEFRLASAMTHGGGGAVRGKVEVLTASYPIKALEKGCRI